MGVISGQVTKDGVPVAKAKVKVVGIAPEVNLISDCYLWLRADQGIVVDENNNISQWLDQSGAGNHAFQGTTSKQPVLQVDKNVYSIRFKSGAYYLELPKSIFNGVLGADIYIVAGVDQILSDRQVLIWSTQGDDSNSRIQFRINDGTGNLVAGGSTNDYDGWSSADGAIVKTGEKVLLNARYDFNLGEIEVYQGTTLGGSDSTLGGGGVSATDAKYPPLLGGYLGDTRLFTGNMYEVLIFNRMLTDDERARLNTYFEDKYKLGLTNLEYYQGVTDSEGNYQFSELDINREYHVLVEYQDEEGKYQAKSYPFISPV